MSDFTSTTQDLHQGPHQDLHQDRWPSAERRPGTHRLSTSHLVMGIVFLAMAGVWALVAGDLVGSDDVRWLLPVPFVLGGAAGLVSLTQAARRGPDRPA